MINYTKATVFNTPARAIVNTVNCLGVMGAGLALEFKLRYPQMYEDYRQKCQQKQIKTGALSTYKTEDNLLIINFPTKFNWRYPSKIEWLEQGLKYFVQHYQLWGIKSVAFPKLGCEHGGLNWHNVKVLMEKYLTDLDDLDVCICLDSEIEPQGIEKVMLQLLQQSKLWIEGLKIKSNISQKIIANLPRIKRFRHLQKTSGIGKETYQKLFQFLYFLAKEKILGLEAVNLNNKIETEQKSLLTLIPETSNKVEKLTTTQVEFELKNNNKSSVKVDSKLKNDFKSSEENNSEVKTKSQSKPIKNKTFKPLIPKSDLVAYKQSSSTEDLRIKLALILSNLDIAVEQIRFLTWDSLINIDNEYQIKLDTQKTIDIPVNIWQELQKIKTLQKVKNNPQLIISSIKKSKSEPNNKPLAVSTIKKIITQGRKEQAQLQQLELPLAN